MSESNEQPLAGGLGAGTVVRVGETVRRPLGPHSQFVHALLHHLEAAGFPAAPRFLGTDEAGREVLSYIEGWTPRPDWATIRDLRWTDGQLVAVALLIRALHDATAGTPLAAGAETVCHNDLSPFNTVFRARAPVAFIDFDAAAPGCRLDDLSQPFWLYGQLGCDGLPVGEQARRLRLLCESYGCRAADLRDPFRRGSELHIARHEQLRGRAKTAAGREAEEAVLRLMEDERRWTDANAGVLFGS